MFLNHNVPRMHNVLDINIEWYKVMRGMQMQVYCVVRYEGNIGGMNPYVDTFLGAWW